MAVPEIIGLPDGARLLPGAGPAERQLAHLAGRVGQHTSLRPAANYPNLARAHVEWLVAAPPGAALELTIAAARVGTRRATIVTDD